jgi:membrane dipeptidase
MSHGQSNSPEPMRLIDLHCNWALQYACESSQYQAELYHDVPSCMGQVNGYLMGTAAAVLACGRRLADWAGHADPWRTLGDMIARYEAEFSGRLLLGPDDVERWRAEPPDGLCWGVLGIEGFDFLIREPGDLVHLPGLFERGVRVFQLVQSGWTALGGAAMPGDDRGLGDLGRAFLESLYALAPAAGQPGPRPVVDLANLNAQTTSDALAWFESDGTRPERLVLVRSCGALDPDDRQGNAGLTRQDLTRFRALGGVIGLSVGATDYPSAIELKAGIERVAAIPFEGRPGYEGMGIGTNFLALEQPIPRLENVSRITEWLTAEFGPEVASMFAQRNASKLLVRAAGYGDIAACSQEGYGLLTPFPSY